MAGAVSVAGPAGVLAERLFGGDGQAEGVSVSDGVDLVLVGVQGLSVLVPRHLGPRGGVDDAKYFRLVALASVDKRLLLVNLRTVCNDCKILFDAERKYKRWIHKKRFMH